MTATQAFPLPILYTNNFQVEWGSNTTLTVTNGQSRNTTNVQDISNTTASTTINAAVNGVNGLDTGTLATGMYYVFAIGSSLNVIKSAFLLSASSTAPVLPEGGYDEFTLIAAWPVDGSAHFYKGYYSGTSSTRTFFLDTAYLALNGGTSTSLAAIDLSAVVPPIQNIPVLVNVQYTPATAGDKVSIFPGDSTATVGAFVPGSVASQPNAAQIEINARLVSSKAQLLYINSAASGSTKVWVNGFRIFI